MAHGFINVYVGETLEQDFDSICEELGLSTSIAVRILAKKMIREKRLPFEVSIDPFYSDANMKESENPNH